MNGQIRISLLVSSLFYFMCLGEFRFICVADLMRRMLQIVYAIYNGHEIQPIPADHDVYSSADHLP